MVSRMQFVCRFAAQGWEDEREAAKLTQPNEGKTAAKTGVAQPRASSLRCTRAAWRSATTWRGAARPQDRRMLVSRASERVTIDDDDVSSID